MEIIFTLEEIALAAKKILYVTTGRNVLAVQGDMGAGKTTLIHALCAAMGVQDHVSSPTFSIINLYKGARNKTIYHMDLYRLKDEQEVISSGVEECLFSGDTCLVEWPERAGGIFPEDTAQLFITALNSNTRKLIIKNTGIFG